jgi:hypothetical protein
MIRDRELGEGVREPCPERIIRRNAMKFVKMYTLIARETSIEVSHEEGAVGVRGGGGESMLQESLLFVPWGGWFNMSTYEVQRELVVLNMYTKPSTFKQYMREDVAGISKG